MRKITHILAALFALAPSACDAWVSPLTRTTIKNWPDTDPEKCRATHTRSYASVGDTHEWGMQVHYCCDGANDGPSPMLSSAFKVLADGVLPASVRAQVEATVDAQVQQQCVGGEVRYMNLVDHGTGVGMRLVGSTNGAPAILHVTEWDQPRAGTLWQTHIVGSYSVETPYGPATMALDVYLMHGADTDCADDGMQKVWHVLPTDDPASGDVYGYFCCPTAEPCVEVQA